MNLDLLTRALFNLEYVHFEDIPQEVLNILNPHVKNDLRKSCDQKDLLPININLSTIGKTISERIALAG